MDIDKDPFPFRVMYPWKLTKHLQLDKRFATLNGTFELFKIAEKNARITKECIDWCKLTYGDNWSTDKYGFMFATEKDATMFILKFGLQ